ncbi:Hypothetical protein CAP_7462 [Chondromyces apiculatus DSM 436]|uniref:Uncharacterized protein n=1 Tax=Chondromyces apiculatus DSM 436 TaxID=1192034 RepID=A0A017SZE9_9BACT|nr:Hypothetical protein CAP_7462 [Chondromyces apiculatus DSM 436]
MGTEYQVLRHCSAASVVNGPHRTEDRDASVEPGTGAASSVNPW